MLVLVFSVVGIIVLGVGLRSRVLGIAKWFVAFGPGLILLPYNRTSCLCLTPKYLKT